MAYYQAGRIEVICGPMFSGKTEELIRLVRRAEIARQKVQIFKPKIDNRYHETNVVSHSSLSVQAQAIDHASAIFSMLEDTTRVIAIDEVQFFSEDIVDVVRRLARRGYRVICAGLDLDYREVPFGPMPTLLAIADEIEKIKAICTVCGHEASRTFRKSESDSEQILLGETDLYEARCRAHYDLEVDVVESVIQVNTKDNIDQSVCAQ